MLELDDIQSGVLRPRPAPYAAVYVLFRIDDRKAGRELMRRIRPVVASAAHPESPAGDNWVSVALTFQGLKALGVPQASLDSFSPEFQQGMAARAKALGDSGESSPDHWEKPLGSSDVHIVLTGLAPDTERLEAAVARAREQYQAISGIAEIWRQNCHALADGREPFGFRDAISQPAIEGWSLPASNPHERPFKAGEFVLGYPDEMGDTPAVPEPDVLGRNGSYAVFRKLHQRVAAFRQFLKANSSSPEGEELLAAKMMGRWRSGAPLAVCPMHDDPELGADPRRNNAFLYRKDDPIGYDTPAGSHVRRTNPRDADIAGVARIHRMIRRGTAYGPPLPDGVLEEDGLDRGLMFAFIGANIGRQFEFVQSQWVNDGSFFGGDGTKDPIAGAQSGADAYSFPRRPLPARPKGLSRFVVTRGGEYCFLPGLRALRWLGELGS
jgi:Dyp-type peroxidase family